MQIPARILRAQADSLPGATRRRTQRDIEQEERILRTARSLFARHGRTAITFGAFALALRMSTTTLRRHFTDLDAILGELILRHLRFLIETIGSIPQDTPDLHAARRAAYLKATRTFYGAPTEAQSLLVQQRQLLPPDLAEPVETLRQGVASFLAAPNTPGILDIIEATDLTITQIEAAFAALVPPQPNQQENTPLPEPIHVTAITPPDLPRPATPPPPASRFPERTAPMARANLRYATTLAGAGPPTAPFPARPSRTPLEVAAAPS